MGIVRDLIERRYTLADAAKTIWGSWASNSATGVSVNHNTALTLSTYFAGVRLLAETVGQLPLIVYRRLQPRGKSRATDRILYRLLHDEPNPEMGPSSFKEALQGQAVSWGNAFAEIDWDMQSGTPRAIWPLRSDKMKVGRDPVTKELIYSYTLPDGTPKTLPSFRVWHLTGFGFDGLIGYDCVSLAREAIGLGLAMEKFGAKFFGNGSALNGILTHPNKLADASRKNMRQSWEDMHSGLENSHRVAILEEGVSYKDVGIPPENAQFLESRKFEVREIARWLNIPPHMLRDLDNATFTNIEHQGIEFVTYTMTPWLTRWEETCSRKLLLPSEKNTFFCEFLVDALLRGDSVARAQYMRERFYLASLSPNDIRELNNENPIDDPMGDQYFVQANMVPLSMAGQTGTQAQQGQSQTPKVLFQRAMRTIAEREKQNILRAAKRCSNDDDFRRWLGDFYRDFPEYIERQMESIAGDTRTFTLGYIGQSVKELRDLTPANAETVLADWENRRPSIASPLG